MVSYGGGYSKYLADVLQQDDFVQSVSSFKVGSAVWGQERWCNWLESGVAEVLQCSIEFWYEGGETVWPNVNKW